MTASSNGSSFQFHPGRDHGTLDIGGGHEIAFRLTGSGEPDVLVICFHGATSRQKIALPRFQAAFDAGPHSACLSICDPTLDADEALRIGWYSGSDSFPLRSILEELLRNTVAEFGPRRTLFLGSSSGGYAALLYARVLDGAVSLTINPQTDILSYYSGHVGDYFAACWPHVPEAERRRGPLICDLTRLYQDNPRNVTTVMLSSAGDRHHFVNHVSRFVGECGRSTRSRLILASDFFGRIGHGGSIPPSVIRRWFNAVLMSVTTDPESILAAYHAQPPAAAQQPPVSYAPQAVADPQDLRLADLLRNYHLHQPTES